MPLQQTATAKPVEPIPEEIFEETFQSQSHSVREEEKAQVGIVRKKPKTESKMDKISEEELTPKNRKSR